MKTKNVMTLQTKIYIGLTVTAIFAIGIFGGANSMEEAGGPALLSAISEPTGGHHFIGGLRELPDIAAKIGVELRNQYLIAYTPSNTERNGKYRRITVRLVPPRGLPKPQG